MECECVCVCVYVFVLASKILQVEQSMSRVQVPDPVSASSISCLTGYPHTTNTHTLTHTLLYYFILAVMFNTSSLRMLKQTDTHTNTQIHLA